MPKGEYEPTTFTPEEELGRRFKLEEIRPIFAGHHGNGFQLSPEEHRRHCRSCLRIVVVHRRDLGFDFAAGFVAVCVVQPSPSSLSTGEIWDSNLRPVS
ncbi:hypothetical protein Nepgr_032496 [Nepenthes gracilis]|uniref:Uncharacterized protein n=1 Tax=Nepenthes gracilis TaxID=150966 RepID=A0AAD3TKJ7_NEPGR|nr:hypothetical protein Nepgr_032496 [Nepenthes gracilis]